MATVNELLDLAARIEGPGPIDIHITATRNGEVIHEAHLPNLLSATLRPTIEGVNPIDGRTFPPQGILGIVFKLDR